ncbi:MAG TPA: YidC/Oxa1 family insertase periplasmic-domain containing protein, partial [Verrucomicrobiae bacterium]
MDKTGIIVVTLCALLLGWWFVEQNKYAKQQAEYARAHPVAATQTNANKSAEAPASTPATPTLTPAVFNTNAPEQFLVLTNAQARYTFTSRGGGLKLVELLDYPQTISARWTLKKGAQTNGVASLNTMAPVPALAVIGDATWVGDGNFTLTKSAQGVRAEKAFTNGLRLVKEFRLSSNYLVYASMKLENTSGQTLNLPAQEIVVGTATPMDADDNGQGEGAMWCDGSKASDQPLAAFAGGGCFMRSAPKSEIIAGSGNVVWAAAHNQFFALIGMPQDKAQNMVARPVT